MNGKRGKLAFRVVENHGALKIKNPRVWGIHVSCSGGSEYTFKAGVTRTLPINDDAKWHLKQALQPTAKIKHGTLKINGTFTSSTKGKGTIRVNFKTTDSKACASGPLAFDKGYISP